MARQMALAGVDPSELVPQQPPQGPRTFKEKWDNFWYHYKIHFWIAATILFIAAVIVVQTVTDDPADYEVVMVTELALYPDELASMEAYLASVGEDVDGDGKVEVAVENLVPNYKADGTSSIGMADQQKMINYLAAGEKMIFVFDRPSYEGFTLSITEVTGEEYHFFTPLNTAHADYDAQERCWCWQSDPRRIEFKLDTLPADMVFGVRTPEGTAGDRRAEELCEQGKALIEALTK